MLKFGRLYPEVIRYLPAEKREINKLPREYVSTVLYSVIGAAFAAWVERRIVERNEKIAEEQNLNTEMDPDVYAAFMKSSSISGKYIIIPIDLFQYSPERKFTQSLQSFCKKKTLQS